MPETASPSKQAIGGSVEAVQAGSNAGTGTESAQSGKPRLQGQLSQELAAAASGASRGPADAADAEKDAGRLRVSEAGSAAEDTKAAHHDGDDMFQMDEV